MQGLFLLKNLTEIELIDAVKTSARAYLFAARNYDEIDVIDFMLEKWADGPALAQNTGPAGSGAFAGFPWLLGFGAVLKKIPPFDGRELSFTE